MQELSTWSTRNTVQAASAAYLRAKNLSKMGEEKIEFVFYIDIILA